VNRRVVRLYRTRHEIVPQRARRHRSRLEDRRRFIRRSAKQAQGGNARTIGVHEDHQRYEEPNRRNSWRALVSVLAGGSRMSHPSLVRLSNETLVTQTSAKHSQNWITLQWEKVPIPEALENQRGRLPKR